ncbi:MAG: hypothetical protein C4327_14050 [Meiothermus sp.]
MTPSIAFGHVAALESGVFYGVTTNPLLLREARLHNTQLPQVLSRRTREVWFREPLTLEATRIFRAAASEVNR